MRVEYSLTPLGWSLTGPLMALYEWAETNAEQVRGARAAYQGAAEKQLPSASSAAA